MKIKSESKIQQEIVCWFNNNYCLKHHNPRNIIFAVPNGGSRDIREAMTLKNTGLLPGVSDLIVIHNGEVLFVEVKIDTGRQSEQQKEFQNRVEQNGFKYHLVRSLDEFKPILTHH